MGQDYQIRGAHLPAKREVVKEYLSTEQNWTGKKEFSLDGVASLEGRTLGLSAGIFSIFW